MHPKFPLVPLGEIATRLQYGTSLLATSEPVGLPVLRMNNLQDDGWDLADLKYIDLPAHEAELYRLNPGDILFNRTNSKELVGKCEVFRESGHWVFASYLIRVTLDESKALPDFVSRFLNTKAGRAQIDRVSRQIVGMSNINAEEIRELLIPLPRVEIQRSLVAELGTARSAQQKKLAQADALLSGLDAYLLNQLGLTAPANDQRQVFAIRLTQIDGPINPERYMGLNIEKLIKGITIEGVAKILEKKIAPSIESPNTEWDWIRIDDLQNQPLSVQEVRTALGSEIEGSFFEVQENDILLARLGPTIQNAKFVLCPRLNKRTVASSEFLVLRCREGWNPTVVLWTLRTSLFRKLIYSKGRGGTPSRYRVNREDLAALPFPIIDEAKQKVVLAEINTRLKGAQRLRQETAVEWAEAKVRFEQKLLGEEA